MMRETNFEVWFFTTPPLPGLVKDQTFYGFFSRHPSLRYERTATGLLILGSASRTQMRTVSPASSCYTLAELSASSVSPSSSASSGSLGSPGLSAMSASGRKSMWVYIYSCNFFICHGIKISDHRRNWPFTHLNCLFSAMCWLSSNIYPPQMKNTACALFF